MRVGFAAATLAAAVLWTTMYGPQLSAARTDASIHIDSALVPPRWAQLERRLLADQLPACTEFFTK